jgi:LacI family transcriptional regulator
VPLIFAEGSVDSPPCDAGSSPADNVQLIQRIRDAVVKTLTLVTRAPTVRFRLVQTFTIVELRSCKHSSCLFSDCQGLRVGEGLLYCTTIGGPEAPLRRAHPTEILRISAEANLLLSILRPVAARHDQEHIDRAAVASTAVLIQRRHVQVSADKDGPLLRNRPPTIRDVARAAGVSVGTASKALNGQGRLRDETRRRVSEEAERLEFRPNDLIKSLLRGRTFTVGLVTTDYFGRFNMPVIAGIEDALGAAEILVFICNTRDDPAREQKVVASLLAKQVDGIIVMGRRIDSRPPVSIGRNAVPVVYAFASISDPSALCVLPDDHQGAQLAVDHLWALGRRRIAHITGPIDREAVRLRRVGFRDRLAAHGVDVHDDHIVCGDWTEASGYEAAERIVSLDPTVDAIFCGSDIIARGVLDRLRECGKTVPDDVAVVGFDNWDILATQTRPTLTTVDMNLHDLGKEAAGRLLALVEGIDESGVIRLPCTLVVRESTGGVPLLPGEIPG